jgi:acyl-CoA hydrolase
MDLVEVFRWQRDELEVCGSPARSGWKYADSLRTAGRSNRRRLQPGVRRRQFSALLRPAEWPRISPHERCVVFENRKLILGIGAEVELYDLASDPGEQPPTAPDSPAATALRNTRARFAERAAGSRATQRTLPPEPEMRKQLRGLGYVELPPPAPCVRGSTSTDGMRTQRLPFCVRACESDAAHRTRDAQGGLVKIVSATEAAALLRPIDTLSLAFGPGLPTTILEELSKRDDWEDLTVFGGMLGQYFELFTRRGVKLIAAFYGPVERALRAAGHDVSFVPGDFRRFQLFAEKRPARVVVTSATAPDADGWMSLSLHAGALVTEIGRVVADPERVLVVAANSKLPRTRGIEPDHPHRVHIDQVDYLIESDADLVALDDPEPSEIERAIAEHIRPFVPDRATIQTGIGGIPGTVAALLADGPGGEYGIHSEMFTNGLMRLHLAGKVTNEHKGIFQGISVTTFAMGSQDLYDWLDGGDEVRFLPVDLINSPTVIGENRNMRSINGALMLDLAGQVVADTINGRQHSGIGGHEDFTSGASLEADDRSMICLPSTVEVKGKVQSRIHARYGAGTIITTPRHQLDIVVTEYGATEVAGLTVRERARALAEVAHPDFRDELRAAAETFD